MRSSFLYGLRKSRLGRGLVRKLLPFWEAYALWLRCDCVDLSAAFAYHTLQSFFPGLLIALALASRILGRDGPLLDRLMLLAQSTLPLSVVPIFEVTLKRFLSQGFGAGLLGAVLLVLSAGNIYLTLQRGADRLWWDRPYGFDDLPWQKLIGRFIWLRLKAVGVLLLTSLFIVLDQLVSGYRFFGSTFLRAWIQEWLPWSWSWIGSLSVGVDLLISFLIGLTATSAFLWLLPSRSIAWRSVLPGAFVISTVMMAFNFLLARSLFLLSIRFQAYGVVGGVLVLTLWVWLVGVFLYYGQCFSVVMVKRRRGWRSEPCLPG